MKPTFSTKTNTTSAKTIKLFNSFCYLWYVVATLLIIGRMLTQKVFIDKDIALHLSLIAFIAILQILHSRKYYNLARTLYILILIAAIYAFCNIMMPGNMREFYFLAVPPITLIFIDNKYLKYFLVLLAFACFSIPNTIYEYYKPGTLGDPTQWFLFFSIFFIVDYFKRTNQKNEQALQAKTEELEKLNSFKSQFFNNISHEIRTPITLIKGETEKLKKLAVQQPEITTIETSINNQIYKITEMVNDVLDLAKMESSEFKINKKNTKLCEVITKLEVNFESLFKQKNINFKVINNAKNTWALLDTTLLQRAISNIILNAYKYCDEHGNVTIKITNTSKDIVISITDNGIGIPNNELKNIFNRFYQVENHINKAGGSGIGLAFSKEIIELHNGQLQVESELHKGSSFIITLPFIHHTNVELPANQEQPKIVTQKQQPSISKNKTFLIVEDNIEMRLYLKNLLQDHTCIEAANGVEGLGMLKNNAVDFIITDYMMPKMDGLEFVTSVKNRCYDIPIIMLTAKAEQQSKLTVLKLGIDDYITKPFESEELLIRIKNLLKNHKNKSDFLNEDKKYEPIEPNNSEKILEKIQTFVFENCSNPKLTQDHVIHKFNLSKSSLYRKIKSETGLTPSEYIKEVKLQKAREIIEKSPKILLKQVALDVGFQHTSYFSKLYFQRFGKKPLRKNDQ